MITKKGKPMKIRGKITQELIELENIKIQNIFMPILDEIDSIQISDLVSSNSTLDLKYWEESGIIFEYHDNLLTFYGKENILYFLKIDEIFKAQGQVRLKNKQTFQFNFDNGIMKLEGQYLPDLKRLFFKDIPAQEGNFLIKIGFSIHKILFYKDSQETSCYVLNKQGVSQENVNTFYLKDFFYALFLALTPIVFLILSFKRPIFLLIFLPSYIPALLFLNKIKRERFFKNLWKA